MLIGRGCQPGPEDGFLLGLQRLGRVVQDVHHAGRRDHDAEVLDQSLGSRQAGAGDVFQRHQQRAEPRTILAVNAGRQRTAKPALRRREPDFAAIADVVGVNDQVLNDHVVVADEGGVGRQ
jgi:hypothetical protein